MSDPVASEQRALTSTQRITSKDFLQDYRFWMAVGAGPVFWFSLLLLGDVRVNQGLSMPLLSLFLLIVIYPLLEEIVFRGAVQGFLLERFARYRHYCGISLANAVTSVVFTIMHFINHPPLAAALVFFPSLIFGWARDRYRLLAAPMILHMFYNAGYLLLFG